jgi:hypothetical protein
MTVPFDIYDLFIIRWIQFLVNKKATLASGFFEVVRLIRPANITE